MRRGYYGWDSNELPLSALEDRRQRLQAAMRAQNLDGLIIYTNIARPAAVSWLTGFTPYWSEGLLFVPRDGAPEFATALSKRVAEWMRSVTPIGDIVNTPTPATFFGERLAREGGAKRLGVLELDLLPSAQATGLMDAAPNVALVDATDLYNGVRQQRDEAELRLFARAAIIAEQSLSSIPDWRDDDVYGLIGRIEKSARDARAEEVLVTLAPDLAQSASFARVDRIGEVGGAFALRVSVAYKSTWIRRTLSIANDPAIAPGFAALETAFDEALHDLGSAQLVGARLAAAFANVRGAALTAWTLESCRGSYPLETLASSATSDIAAPSASVLTAHVALAGRRWVSTRPVLSPG